MIDAGLSEPPPPLCPLPVRCSASCLCSAARYCAAGRRDWKWSAIAAPMRSLLHSEPITRFVAVHALARRPIGAGGADRGGGRKRLDIGAYDSALIAFVAAGGRACVVPPLRRALNSIVTPPGAGLSGSAVMYPFAGRSPGGARWCSLRLSAGASPLLRPPPGYPPFVASGLAVVARARAVPGHNSGWGFALL